MIRLILIIGIASQYAPHVMSKVVAYRQAQGQLSHNTAQYAGFVAVPDCADIGRELWVHAQGQPWELMLVADCASKSDSRWQDGLSGYEWMRRNSVLVEVDYQTAERWGTVGRAITVETSHADPWRWRAGGVIQ